MRLGDHLRFRDLSFPQNTLTALRALSKLSFHASNLLHQLLPQHLLRSNFLLAFKRATQENPLVSCTRDFSSESSQHVQPTESAYICHEDLWSPSPEHSTLYAQPTRPSDLPSGPLHCRWHLLQPPSRDDLCVLRPLLR